MVLTPLFWCEGERNWNFKFDLYVEMSTFESYALRLVSFKDLYLTQMKFREGTRQSEPRLYNKNIAPWP